ncbi:MAG: alpha-amylase family glycosyl hydrolase, partial [Prolixibacteraceae bacterium]
PIGETNRKGKNNNVKSEPGEPGSPWAIGGKEGGHKAIHPELGTMEDFQELIAAAKEKGIEIAMDVAFQCSPDHPYVKEHPEWFKKRPDGSLQYAENPPKKYEDIYPIYFESDDWENLWEELKSVFLFWIEKGVKIFRVDNPHTKSLRFWGWAIQEIKKENPDVIFLAEAFTRPKVMYNLAKQGFTQSYTYFTWRNTKYDLVTYCKELVETEVREFFRPNFWPNTPDILPEFLQVANRAGYIQRLVLAATLSSNYGIYGPAFELMERTPVRPGKEEYLNSEKYEIKNWDINNSNSLKKIISKVNAIRNENKALQNTHSLKFHHIDNEALICYSKASDDLNNIILVVVSLDPHHTHSGWLHFPVREFEMEEHHPYQVHDLFSGEFYLWEGEHNFVEINPGVLPMHIFQVKRKVRSERDFDYFM